MITNFPARPDYNPGGYASFKFIPHHLVTSFPTAVNQVISSAIVTSSDWLQGYSTYETLNFTEPGSLSAHGTIYKPQLTGFVPGENAELSQLLSEMERVRFILQLTNPQGKIRIIGSPDIPLDFTSSFSSGGQRSAAKGYTFKFDGNTLSRAPFYQL